MALSLQQAVEVSLFATQLAVVEGAETCARRVPHDLSVVGYGNFPWTAHFRPPLTALHQNGWQLGCTLGAKLLGIRDGDSQHSGITILPMDHIVRKSTAAAPPDGPRGARNRK